MGFGLADPSVAFHFRRSRHAQRLQETLVVAQVLDGVRDDHEAHVQQVGRGHFEDLLRELLAVLVDLLDAHGSHDGPLMTLQRLQSDLADLLFAFAEKLLTGEHQHFLVLSLYLDLCDSGDGNGHPLVGVHQRALHNQRHCVQRNFLDTLDEGPDEGDATTN